MWSKLDCAPCVWACVTSWLQHCMEASPAMHVDSFGKICFLILIQCGPLSWYTVYLKAILHMKCDFVNSFAKWNDLAHILTQKSYLNEVPPNPTNLVFPSNRYYSVSIEQKNSFNKFEEEIPLFLLLLFIFCMMRKTEKAQIFLLLHDYLNSFTTFLYLPNLFTWILTA